MGTLPMTEKEVPMRLSGQWRCHTPRSPRTFGHSAPTLVLSPLHLDWGRERLRVELQAIKTLGLCSRTGAKL